MCRSELCCQSIVTNSVPVGEVLIWFSLCMRLSPFHCCGKAAQIVHCAESSNHAAIADPKDVNLMLMRYDRVTARILNKGTVHEARQAMQRSSFPHFLPLFDSIRRALACSRESPDVVKRYEEMLMRLRRAAEYMMSARVNAVPLEVLQLVRVWREYCCHRFAWALISISDIQWLQTQLMERSNKTYHPLTILDPLAGTGWHCYLMRGLGWTSSFEVSDSHPASPSMLWVTPVCARDALESVRAMPRADVLWLSWPPHEPQPIAFSLLNAFCGCTVIYIGEWPAASTTSVSQGARMFFEALRSDWIEKARRKAEVNWPGYEQELVALERKRHSLASSR